MILEASMILEFLFWLSGGCLIFTYIGYPVLMCVLASVWPGQHNKAKYTPSVSLVISAYNEETEIRDKIENSLSLDYPKENLEILVVSDCSTDGTDDIVRSFESKGVTLISLPTRQGKTVAQNVGVLQAKGDIIVFSDASIMIPRQSLSHMIDNFSDSHIGCVSCEDKSVKVKEGKKVEDEGLYVRYEMQIRRWESVYGSIVGASGCFYAVRKKLWRKPEGFMVVDFTTPLDVYEQGYRAISDPDAVAYVRTSNSAQGEFARRVRTATRGQVGLLSKRNLFNPFKYGFFSFQLIGHKLFRFLAPVFLGMVFMTNIFLLSQGWLYQVSMMLQIGFYVCAGIGRILESYQKKYWIFSFPFYFIMVNVAILVAWCRVFQGKTDTMWAPTQRVSV